MNVPPSRAVWSRTAATMLFAAVLVTSCGVSRGEQQAAGPTTSTAPSAAPVEEPSFELGGSDGNLTEEEIDALVEDMSDGSVPTEATWSTDQPAFDALIADLDEADLAGEDYTGIDLPDQVGDYEILNAWSQDGALIITTSVGFDDMGVAYLPEGPFPELENGGFERPEFTHLGGPWYSWTASW